MSENNGYSGWMPFVLGMAGYIGWAVFFSFGNRFPSVDVVIGRIMFGGFGLLIAWLDIHFAIVSFKKIIKNEPFEN